MARRRRLLAICNPGQKAHVVVAPGRPACGADVVMHPSWAVAARDVPVADRCRAPGCRVRWPADLRAVGGS